MAKLSKRKRSLQEATINLAPMDIPTAVTKLKSLETNLPKGVKPSRFDQTVEVALRLGIDPKRADQIVRGSIVYPHGVGKAKRVLVFCQGDDVAIAQKAGADHVGGKELADKIKEGWMDFDVAIATPSMMGIVGPLGRVLGPQGLMPSPRAGTVTQDVAGAVKEYKAGKIDFRCNDHGIVHVVVGKMSFDAEKLVANVTALVDLIKHLRPTGAKGVYIRSVTLSATQMPGIPLAVA